MILPSCSTIRIAIAQLNPTVGDIAGNIQKARAVRAYAAQNNADLVVYTELFVSGYPAQDLILNPSFLESCEQALKSFVLETADGGPGFVMGVPLKRASMIFNAVIVADAGKIIGESYKTDLPEYNEFSEKRIFSPALDLPKPLEFRGIKLGILICEDLWGENSVCKILEEQGAKIFLVINASPFYRDKTLLRYEVARKQIDKTHLPLIYANQVGGQDELVFDGASFALSSEGDIVLQMPHFEEFTSLTTWTISEKSFLCEKPSLSRIPSTEEADYRACMLGLRDYVIKNDFKDVLLGLSGGIDSIFCATLAVDSFGSEHVHAVMMPFCYTSQESLQNARNHAQSLGIRYTEIPIVEPVEVFEKTLCVALKQKHIAHGTLVHENLQSRMRGVLLMALSNHFNSMLLSTGNKSELSVGYATLYGDMNGGFNPLKDLYKTRLLALASWRNHNRPLGALGPLGVLIPDSVMQKEPSAELSQNQKDLDTLPAYPILDAILECLIEKNMRVCDIISQGYDRSTVEYVENLLFLSEYKRYQSPPGVKLTQKSLNRDRRYPLTNRFRDRG